LMLPDLPKETALELRAGSWSPLPELTLEVVASDASPNPQLDHPSGIACHTDVLSVLQATTGRSLHRRLAKI
jgi:hypothetical protein